MSTHTRTTKSNGTTQWEDGEVILHSEFNSEWDSFLNDYNGSVDEGNIDPAAQILNSSLVDIANDKVVAHGTTAALLDDTVSPGDTGTPSLPTMLDDELKRMRYRIRANNGFFASLQYMDAASAIQTASWTEPGKIGRNMLPNPGFELQSGPPNSAPDGWTLVGVPTTVAIEPAAIGASGAEKRSLNIVGSGATTGISRVVTGLKPGVKYLVGMAYTLTAGEVQLTTADGLATGNYQNLVFTDTSTGGGYEIFNGIVKADATPSNITVSIHSTANADDFNLFYVWFYEISDHSPVEIPHIPMQTVEDDTELIYPAAASAGDDFDWETMTPLSLSQYVPYEGYRFVYEVTVCWNVEEIAGAPDNDFENYAHGLRVQIDGTTDGGEKIIYGELASGSGNAIGHVVTLKAIVENPTPGTTVDFTTDIGVYNQSSGSGWGYAIANPLRPTDDANPSQASSNARLYTERI